MGGRSGWVVFNKNLISSSEEKFTTACEASITKAIIVQGIICFLQLAADIYGMT